MLDKLEANFEVWRKSGDTGRLLVTLFTLSGTFYITFWLFRFSFQLLKGLKLYVLSQLFPDKDFLKKYGKWALVTGSTDGIGLAMARELATRGHSIIVVGRNQEKLKKAKSCLEMIKNVGEVMTVEIDLFDSSLANYERIYSEIDPNQRDIGILINNAGIFESKLAPYHRLDMENIRNMVNVNVLAALHFTRIILPGMLKRERGLIINVSSSVSELETAYVGVYPQTKTFISAFSRMLQIEYAAKPIDIINLTTGMVATKLNVINKTLSIPFLCTTPESYARSSLNAASTLISSYSGAIPHALLLQLGLLFDGLGLNPYFIKMFRKYHVGREKVFGSNRQNRDD